MMTATCRQNAVTVSPLAFAGVALVVLMLLIHALPFTVHHRATRGCAAPHRCSQSDVDLAMPATSLCLPCPAAASGDADAFPAQSSSPAALAPSSAFDPLLRPCAASDRCYGRASSCATQVNVTPSLTLTLTLCCLRAGHLACSCAAGLELHLAADFVVRACQLQSPCLIIPRRARTRCRLCAGRVSAPVSGYVPSMLVFACPLA